MDEPDAIDARVLALARALGVPDAEPRLLWDGANRVLRLGASGPIARVATVTARVRGAHAFAHADRAVRVSSHLHDAGVPVQRPLRAPPPGPHRHEGLLVTFWDALDHDPERPLDPVAAASALARVHEALAGCAIAIPRLAPLLELPAILARLEEDGALTRAEAGALGNMLARARVKIDALGLEDRVVHGDATVQNILRAPEGPAFIDFEDVCAGPVEWDLACLVATARAFGRKRPGAEELLAAYGAPDAERLRPFIAARVVQALVWGLAIAQDQPARDRDVRRWLSFWLEDGWLRFGV